MILYHGIQNIQKGYRTRHTGPLKRKVAREECWCAVRCKRYAGLHRISFGSIRKKIIITQSLQSFFKIREFFSCNEETCTVELLCVTATGPCLKKRSRPVKEKKLYAIANTVVPEKILEVLFEFHLILFK